MVGCARAEMKKPADLRLAGLFSGTSDECHKLAIYVLFLDMSSDFQQLTRMLTEMSLKDADCSILDPPEMVLCCADASADLSFADLVSVSLRLDADLCAPHGFHHDRLADGLREVSELLG